MAAVSTVLTRGKAKMMMEKNTKETLATSASTRENASKYDKKFW